MSGYPPDVDPSPTDCSSHVASAFPPSVAIPIEIRLRQLRVFWLPFSLILLDGVLIGVLILVALVALPLVVWLFGLWVLLRFIISTLSRGRWLSSKLPPEQAESPLRAGHPALSPALRRELALRYRPCLVLFGEDLELGPPYRTDELVHITGADYHPRAVEIFLDQVRLRYGRNQWLPDLLPVATGQTDIRGWLGTPNEHDSSLELPWLHGGSPFKIVAHLFPLSQRIRVHWAVPLPKSDCGCSRVVWERYHHIVGSDAERPADQQRYPHTLYARVLEGRELPEIGDDHPLADAVAVQYWWFLFYNDHWNRHQGDWEGVTIFLRPGPTGFLPLGAAYGVHDLGRWRRWRDVQRVDDAGGSTSEGTHAVVYVARGSHGSYFDYNENGYHPMMSRTLSIPFLGDYKIPSRFAFESRNATDWVADPKSALTNAATILTENVKLMPPEYVLRDLAALRADDDWWWLAYRGLWGAPELLPFFGGSGPRGPRWQGVRWDNPFRWMMRECIADDIPYWLEMFSGWESADRRPGANAEVGIGPNHAGQD